MPLDIQKRVMEYFRIVPLVIALLVVGTLPMMPNAFFWAESNSDLGYSFRLFTIPALLFSFWLVNRQRFRDRLKTWERYLAMPFLAALIVLIINGPVLLVNAKIPPQASVLLEGTVVEKVSASSRSKARIVFIDKKNIRHRWPVHRNIYDTVSIGDRFLVHATRGGLGILYVNSGDTYWELRPATEPK